MTTEGERIVGRFRLLRPLGSGAAATVYEVMDERLGVRRALKRLSPAMLRHPRMRARFVTEARAMARLEHPGVVRVMDVFIDHEDACIVMELMEGGSLVDRLRVGGALAPAVAGQLMVGVLEALTAAHACGVIHRDIKPHNILLDREGRPRVTDFGVARLLGGEAADQDLTRTGATMGTWGYMAPEQRTDAKHVDLRTDLYAAGATLYTLLTAETPRDLFAADLDPVLLAPLPPPLAAVVRRATRYHREERYASAEEMRLDLLQALQQLSLPSTPSPPRPVVSSVAAVVSAESTQDDWGEPSLGRLSTGERSIAGDVSPLEDVALAPPPPLQHRSSAQVAGFLAVAAVIMLSVLGWQVLGLRWEDLIGELAGRGGI